MLIAGALLACALPAAATPVTVAHRQGTVELEAVPARTVVFDLAVLDHLDAMGVDVVGVPDARFPPHLARYAGPEYAKVGTLFEPDLDAVRALDPDLVIVGGRSARKLPALSAIAPTVDLGTGTDGFFAGVLDTIGTLGRVYGTGARAQALVDGLRAQRAAVAELAEGQDGVVLFAIDGRVMAHAPGARFGILHDALGLDAVLPREAAAGGARPEAGSPEAEAAREQQARTLAAALAADPDWLVVLDRGAATGDNASATDLAAQAGVAATRAFREGRVLMLEPAEWYIVGGGYTVLRDTLDGFAERLRGNHATAVDAGGGPSP